MQVKQATMDMLDDVMALEKLVWRGEAAKRESIAKRIDTFPEAFPVAFVEGKLAGFASCARLPILYKKVPEYLPIPRNLFFSIRWSTQLLFPPTLVT